MAGERAINLPLRVQGIGEVERDFKRVGSSGRDGFEQVRKAANGANQEVSEYTARLKRAAIAAKEAFDRSPDVQKARILDPAGYKPARADFVRGAVELEQENIRKGLGETTQMWENYNQKVDGSAISMTRAAAAGAALGLALAGLISFTRDSLEAFEEHEKILNAFHASLELTGNVSSATASQIEAMAGRIAQSTNQTEESALKAAASLAQIPGMTAAGMEAALDVASRLADALGTDVADVITDIVSPAFQALTENDLKKFYEVTEGKVSAALQTMVLDLAKAGKTADAQRVFLEGLSIAAGENTTKTDLLTNSWAEFQREIGKDLSGPVNAFRNLLATALDDIRHKAEATNQSILSVIWTMATNPQKYVAMPRNSGRDLIGASIGSAMSMTQSLTQQAIAAQEIAARRALEKTYGDKPKPKRTGGSGRSGKSDAEREAEKLKREAEQARKAADRIEESNDDVVASYRLRAEEAEARLGQEGDALEAVKRRQEIEAAARRINTELIEKEVEARRKEAAVAGRQFDLAQATAEATAQVELQQDAVRGLAARLIDAERAQADFIRRQAEGKQLWEQTRTPMERVNAEVERSVEALRNGSINADTFNRRMDQLAESAANVAYAADEAAQAWEGFGQDTARVFSDFILDGGEALDVVRELVRMGAERLLFQNFETPLANWIDAQTGNNRDRNIGEARSLLPTAADGAAGSLAAVEQQAYAAAQGLASIALGLENPMVGLTGEAERTRQAMADLAPEVADLGIVTNNVISMFSQLGSGNGGGLLSSLIGIGSSVFGGGIGPSASLTASARAAIEANPALFASGTERVPVGQPFYVGENGRELMELTRGGGLRVYSNQETRRREVAAGGGGNTVINNITIPQRTDPRRTASTVNRATQRALAKAARKGLA